MFKGKWNKYGVSAIVILTILAIFYMIQLNFGSYLDQIWNSLKSVTIPAALALFVSYLIRPMYRKMCEKGLNKNLASLSSMIIFLLIVIMFFALITTLIVTQVQSIVSSTGSVVDLNLEWAFNFLPPETVSGITNADGKLDLIKAFEYLVRSGQFDITENIFKFTVDGIKGMIYWLIMIIMMPVFLFFFLREGDTIAKSIINVIPERFHREDMDVMLQLAHSSTEKYMRGKVISIIFLGIFFSIAFTVALLFFTPISLLSAILYGILFGTIIAILDLVPYIGPGIGIVMPILYIAIASSNMTQFLIFAVIFIIIDVIGQNLQKMFIEPMVMSKEIEIHPLAIFSGLLFFGALFGIVGMIISTPIVATIRSVDRYLRGKYSREEIETIIDKDIDEDGFIGGEIETIDLGKLTETLNKLIQDDKEEE